MLIRSVTRARQLTNTVTFHCRVGHDRQAKFGRRLVERSIVCNDDSLFCGTPSDNDISGYFTGPSLCLTFFANLYQLLPRHVRTDIDQHVVAGLG